jgi:aryl-alcohol dehydrogenase-like predicted oxidoreductase
MKYRYVGNTGLLVSRLSLGTLTLGDAGWGADRPTSVRIIKTYLEKGGNFLDTADTYNQGVSEEIVGEALQGVNRDQVVVGTKVFFRMGEGPNDKGLSRKHIMSACEASLRRLNTDYIDIYTVHGPDPRTPLEETMRTLNDLVRQGKVRYVGCSNYWAWQVVKANAISATMGLEPFVCGQYQHNLLDRRLEFDMLPAFVDQGMGFNCWSPLAGGLLTGKYRGSSTPAAGTRLQKRMHVDGPRFWKDPALAIAEDVCAIADKHAVKPIHIALAWLFGDRRITAAIFGVKTVEQLDEVMVCGNYDLPAEVWRAVEEASRPQPDALVTQDRFARKGTFGEEEFM